MIGGGQAIRWNIDLSSNPEALQRIETAFKRMADTAQRGARDVDSQWGKLSSTLGKFKGVLAGLGLAGAFTAIIRNTIEAQQELAQLEAVLESTGLKAEWSTKKLQDMARGLADASTFSEGAIIRAQTRLLSYSGIVGTNFPRAMQTVIDQSARLGISVEQSAETIGRALESPTKAAAALAQQGFGAAFTDEIKATIKALEEAGREAEAQIIILDILGESYDGAAQAARDTFGGALTALKHTIADLLTGDTEGEGLKGATAAVNELIDLLRSPHTKLAFAETIESIARMGVEFSNGIPKIVQWGSTALDWLERVRSGLAGMEMQGNASLNWLKAVATFDGQGRVDAYAQYRQGSLLATHAMRPADPNMRNVGAGAAGVAGIGARYGVQQPFSPLVNPDGWHPGMRPGQAPTPPPPPPVAAKHPKGGGRTPRASSQRESDAEREARKLQESYASAEEAMKRQIALAGERTEVERMLYEVEQGRYKALDAAQKATLMRLAEDIDLTREKIEQEAKAKAAAEQRTEADIRARDALLESLKTAQHHYDELIEKIDRLHSLGLLSTEQHAAIQKKAAQQLSETLNDASNQWKTFGEQAARNLQSAFADFLFDPFKDGLDGMLRGFIDVLRRMVSEALAAALLKKLFDGMASEDGGGGGGQSWWASLIKGIIGAFAGGSAKGNVFQGGRMTAFANGGIVKGPITFPMANGQFGLMGEAGPEAIMPLRRGADGRLGIDAANVGGARESGDVRIRAIFVDDQRKVADYLNSAPGERVLLQVLHKNGFTPGS